LFRFSSEIQLASEDYQRNVSVFRQKWEEFRKKLETAGSGGPPAAIEKHKERGKLLARERIELLLDSGTAFLELSTMAAVDLYDNQFPSAGIISGLGQVHGRTVVVVANDATVKGGTYVKETIKKHIRAQEIALQNHLPCIYMVDSGGVFLPKQDEVFPDRFDFGRIFYNQSVLSAAGIPQIAIVMGSCTAGGAYVPAMCDETIIVRNQGTIFLGGPPLVKAATGEDVTAEELGGAFVHTSISGVADHLADNDVHAIQICRNIAETFKIPEKQILDIRQPEEPLWNAEEIYGLIPSNSKNPMNIYEVIARIVDGSRFQEFKQNYGTTIITAFAHINGIPVGIIANNGILFSESALKATHFIELCNFRKLPIVFLQNITGFMVGKEYEHKGIARDGAKMVHAVATSTVPRITLIIGGSYGAGNYAMSGRAYDPNFLFMWPNARISVMGGEQAAEVLSAVKVSNHEEKEKLKEEIRTKYERESSAYYSTARLWDDGIIDPADTRTVLSLALSACINKKFPEPKTGIFRM
jgi:acetyl-CoA carboxylase carboxyltransferase component